MTSIWGPPTWIFVHTFASKISDDGFNSNRVHVINLINNIFYCLPCKICSSYFSSQVKKINVNSIETKQNLIDYLYYLHNNVNGKLNKPILDKDKLSMYNSYNLINTLNKYKYYIINMRGHDLFNDMYKRDAAKNISDFILNNKSLFH